MGLLENIVYSEEMFCEGRLCCLGYRRKVNSLYLLQEIDYSMYHPTNEYLNNFVAALNTRASAAPEQLALAILRYRTDQFSRWYLLADFVCETCCRRECLVVTP